MSGPAVAAAITVASVHLFEQMGPEYEQVVWCHDAGTGLKAIIAIHSTVLGPALGGTRYYPYVSEDAALADVLRLSKGMTYKSALAGLDLGGGKAVIIGDPRTSKTEALLRAYGRFVDTLAGRYLTAEDVGTSQADMDIILRETRCVTGVSVEYGGSGDPSKTTASGVRWGMKAVAEHLGQKDGDLAGLEVVISGVGKVGSELAGLLVDEGAKVVVADTNDAAVQGIQQTLSVATVEPGEAHMQRCDIFAPCALGGVLGPKTIPELRCKAVCGAANNQLASDEDAGSLAERGILYAPDFVVNSGGVINVADELSGYNQERALAKVRHIGITTSEILKLAEADKLTTVAAAEALALARIAAVGGVKRIRSH